MGGADGKTHIFRGKTCAEAVSKAKSKLGRDIVVVKRRNVRLETLFSRLTSGKLGGDSLEVELEVAEASRNGKEDAAARPDKPPNPLLRTYAKALEGLEKYNPETRKAMESAAAPFLRLGETATGITGRLDKLQLELEQSRRESADKWEEILSLISLQARGGVPAVSNELLSIHRSLVAKGIDENLAREIVEEVEETGDESPEKLNAELFRAVSRRLPVAAPVLLRETGPTVVAAIGPSGMGKTTTIAKLAIQFGVKDRRRVGLINEDFRRPGAEGQINNLGRMFGLAIATASGPGEMREAVESLAGQELILIDTSGRSPLDGDAIGALTETLRAAGVHETHLVLSSLASDRTLAGLAERFRPAGFDRIIMTKLDESLCRGDILNAMSRLADGLSYVTSSPDYSAPIRAADRAWLAELILGNPGGEGRTGGEYGEAAT